MLILVLTPVLLAGCGAPRATRAECELILERIVDIELQERGYRDPMLQEIKQTAFKKKLGAELDRCVGKRLEKDAIACVRSATTIERLTHDCFGN